MTATSLGGVGSHHLVVERRLLRNVRRVVGVDHLPPPELVDLLMAETANRSAWKGMRGVGYVIGGNSFADFVDLYTHGKKTKHRWAWKGLLRVRLVSRLGTHLRNYCSRPTHERNKEGPSIGVSDFSAGGSVSPKGGGGGERPCPAYA